MGNWWERQHKNVQPATFAFCAVAYYRHSAQDRQENSISIQQDQVRAWAEGNGVKIIHEFMDPGRSGLTAEGRPSFQDMMQNWVKKRNDFQYILCLDVRGSFRNVVCLSRNGEFSAKAGIDVNACREGGKRKTPGGRNLGAGR